MRMETQVVRSKSELLIAENSYRKSCCLSQRGPGRSLMPKNLGQSPGLCANKQSEEFCQLG